MKIVKYWPLSLLLIVVAILGAQLSWRLTVSETGWSTYREQWTSAAISLIGISQRHLGDRDPVDQAKFWLREVEKCQHDNEDPELAIGAAWMLDSPQLGFTRHHFRVRNDISLSALPLEWRLERDDEKINVLSAEFESLCRDACLAKVDKAIQLDPSNSELRRAQAFMLFRTEVIGRELQPRKESWLSVLDECAQADPDNALYDYLAALYLWKSSADYTHADDGYTLKVHDADRYGEANRRLAAGLKKSDLKFRMTAYAATLRFLDDTKLSPLDSLKAANSRLIESRTINLLLSIMRWKRVERDEAKRSGRLDAELMAVRQILAISNQIREPENTLDPLHYRLILQRWSLADLEDIHEHHPDAMSSEEALAVSKQLANVEVELEILGEVFRKPAKNKPASPEISPGSSAVFIKALLPALAIITTPQLVISSFLLALILSLISKFLSKGDRNDSVSLTWYNDIIAWSVALGASVVLLGMFPAEIVSPRQQTWLVCSLMWIGFASFLLGCLILIQKRFLLPAKTVAGLAVTASIPILAAVHGTKILDLAVSGIAILHPAVTIIIILLLALVCWGIIYFLWQFVKNTNSPRRLKLISTSVISLVILVGILAGTALGTLTDDMESQTWIPPRVWKEAQALHIDAQELQSLMKLSGSQWISAFTQWQMYYGPVFVPVIAIIILMIWQFIRHSRQVEGGWTQILRFRKRIELRHACEPAINSCFVFGWVFLAINLGTTSTLIDQLDRHYRTHRTRIEEFAQAWEDIVKQAGEIRADEKTMFRLQAQVDEQNRKIGEQRAQLRHEN